jgi:prepilin-type N-terminal cleavage/methylation domain-containing protein
MGGRLMRARAEHGFTLVELLVAMALAMIVFGATLTAFDVFQTNNRFDQLLNENQDNARTAMNRLARQLRNVAAPGAGYFGALEQAEPYSTTFQTVDSSKAASGENKTNAMRVHYCLDDSTPTNEVLWTQTQKWTKAEAPIPSTSSCPAAVCASACAEKGEGWETKTQLVNHVTNKIGGLTTRPLFIYSATGVPKIIAVESNLFININPGHTRPGETQLTSGVSLRNANRQPIVAFTATPSGGHVLLNASASRDPDGLALTYKWKEDSAVLETTAQQYQTGTLTGSHIFKLEVTNPGGLAACSEAREVTASSTSSKESTEVSCPI